MRFNSLSFRLFVAAVVWSLLALPVTAVILVSVYRGAVERNFDARLNVFLTSLVADAATKRSAADAPPSLRDPNFRLPFSGWYWQITPYGGPVSDTETSESLLDQKLMLPSANGLPTDGGKVHRAYISGPESQILRVLEREITLVNSGTVASRLSVAVAGNAAEIEDSIAQFRNLVIVALSILGLGLAIATYFQVQFGLRPLRAIGRGLSAIRSGDSEILEVELPSEIEPLQTELNALIQSNRAIVERARMHVGNLAHALKTPLSVISNEARKGHGTLARKVREQAGVMNRQITHHLNRASIAARSGAVSGHTRAKPVLEGLARTLARIYVERGLKIGLQCPGSAIFHGEKQDLEEMAGNLMDNACKWAKSEVSVDVLVDGGRIVIDVEDNGKGLPKKARESAMKRGGRLDESKPGSGLGLSIVAELADLYGGLFTLENSEKNGVRARLVLPGS